MSEYVYDLTEKMQTDLRGFRHEPIVRCKDCKHFHFDQSDHEYRDPWWCEWWHTDRVKLDGFCAWGERREES